VQRQVKVRCVGEQGSGHGSYSEPVIVTTPGSREAASKPASVMSEASLSTAGDAGKSLTLVTSGKGRKDSIVQGEDGMAAAPGNSIKGRKTKVKKSFGAGEISMVMLLHRCVMTCLLAVRASALVSREVYCQGYSH